MTMLFCSFTSKPLILRLSGCGEAIQFDRLCAQDLSTHFPTLEDQRQIILLRIKLVQTSYGCSAPFYEFQSERESLVKWSAHKGDDGMQEYRREKNLEAIS